MPSPGSEASRSSTVAPGQCCLAPSSLISLVSDRHFLYRKGHDPFPVPAELLGAVLEYRTFRHPADHAARVAAKMGLDGKGQATLNALLERLRGAGLLLSRADLHEIGEESGGAGPLKTVTVISKDRPELADRCVRSYAANALSAGRAPEVVLLDDSTDEAISREYRRRLAKLRADLDVAVRYAGRERKRLFLRELSSTAGVSAETLETAMLGCPGVAHTRGANTNCALLDAAGSRFLCVDDDSLCLPARPPGTETGLRVSSAGDLVRARLYEDERQLRGDFCGVEADFIGAHEALLGRTVLGCIGETDGELTLELDHRGEGRIAANRARVVVSMSSFHGDVGSEFMNNFLLLAMEPQASFLDGRDRYQAAMGGRWAWKGTTRTLISDRCGLQGVAMGLCAEPGVPPLMPFFRCADNVLGAMIGLLPEEPQIGYTPLSVEHAPDPPRPRQPALAWKGGSVFRFSDLVLATPAAWRAPVAATTREDAIRTLGRHFVEVSSLSRADASDLLFPYLLAAVRAEVAVVEDLARLRGKEPDFWWADVDRFIQARIDLIQTGRLRFADVPGSPEESLSKALDLLRRYGEVLLSWPDIIGAARRLREVTRLSEPI